MDKTLYEKAIGKLAELQKFFTEPVVNEVEKFAAIKEKDSDTEVEVSELKVGGAVTVSSPSGSVPAPDAPYNLVDNSAFTTKDGKIVSIEAQPSDAVDPAPKDAKPATPAVDPAKLADEPVATPATDAAPSNDIQALTDRVTALESAMATVLQVLQGQPSASDVNDFNAKAKDIDSKIELLAKLPTQASADSRVEVKESN